MYVQESGKGLEEVRKAIAFFESHQCLVGIPQEKSSRENEEVTNAELAFIHSMGSPRLHIPARPFIEPAIAQAETQEQIVRHMKAAVVAAIEGDESAATGEMHKAGIAGENAAKNYIGSGNHVPNAKFTLEGGWMRNRISGKPFYAKPKKSNVPLIDTGSLRSSITHVVKER